MILGMSRIRFSDSPRFESFTAFLAASVICSIWEEERELESSLVAFLAENAFNLDWLVEVKFELSSEIIEEARVSEEVFVSSLVV